MAHVVPPPLPEPVSDEMFFQVPELEQLLTADYEYVGKCRVLGNKALEKGFFEFHILKDENKFLVAYTPMEIPKEQKLQHEQTSTIPVYGNAALALVPMQQLPAGIYRLAGSGHLKAHPEVSPSKIYILERDTEQKDGKFLAIESAFGHLPTGCLIEVLRDGKSLTLGIDRNPTGDAALSLTEDLTLAEKSIYEWVDSRFIPRRHIRPELPA